MSHLWLSIILLTCEFSVSCHKFTFYYLPELANSAVGTLWFVIVPTQVSPMPDVLSINLQVTSLICFVSCSQLTLSWKLQEKMMGLQLHHCMIPVFCYLFSVTFWIQVSQHLLKSAGQSWSLPWWRLFTGSIVDCRQFIDCGCLGYIVAALSSKSEGVRSAGSHALSRFCTHLEGAKFREKLQVNHFLGTVNCACIG